MKRAAVAVVILAAVAVVWLTGRTRMAAPNIITADQESATGTGTSLSCDVPSGVSDGELLIATVSTLFSAAHTHTTPSGWTLVQNAATTPSTRETNSVFRKIASSEPASYTFEFSQSTSDALVTINRVTGIDGTTPVNVSAVTADISSSSPESPTATTTVDDCLVLAIVSHLVDTTTDTVPSGMSSVFSATATSGTGIRTSVAEVDQASAGATGAKAWTLSESRRANAFTVAIAPTSTGVSIGTPVQYQTMQRDGSDEADISISGTYVGTPTAIEADFGGGGYETIDASPSGGTFSGTLSGQAAGEGTLTVRFTNDTDVNDTVANVRIGDVFLWIGQSNQDGRITNSQTFDGGDPVSIYDEDDAWINLATGYQAPGASTYSILPLLASSIVDHTGVPAAFVCETQGATGLVTPDDDWASGGTNYAAAMAAVTASGINGCTLILWYQGERDAVNDIATATYYAAESLMLDNMQAAKSALTGVKMVSASIGEVGGADSSDDISRIQQAKIYNWNNDDDILPGPVAHDQSFSDDTHWATNGEAADLAGRWWRAIKAAAYSGTEDARGPRFVSATYVDDTITVNLTGGETPIANGTDATGWAVTDDNGARTVSSVAISGRTVTITCDQTLVEDVTVSYGDGNAANGTTTQDGGSIETMPIESFVDETVSAATDAAPPGMPIGIGLSLSL